MSADGLGEVGMWEGRWYNLMMDGRVYLAGIQGWVVYDILGKGLGMLIMAEGRGMIRRRGKGGGWGLEEGWFMYFYGFGGLAYSRKQRKDTAVTREKPQQDDSVPTSSNDQLLSGEDSMQLSELMILCTNLQKQVLNLEKAKDAQVKEIVDLKKRVQKLERKKKSRTTELKRLRKVDASKHRRSIEDIDKDADVSLVDDTQGRSDDADMFDINELHGDEVVVDMPVGEKQEQSAKEREEPSEFRTLQASQPSMTKDKGKPIMIEPEVPLKRKDQVALDEDLARNLQAQLEAELIEEERLARNRKKKPT
ncbi:hypothetical protein Tco_0679962 [Tanacetum coccineum]|uniref:Uncharacterized protein n=1 Tax=Tanacetum coccineum TaxID=301880 RepID=A0ABQ4XJ96_9ASTR